ncbi:MAG TPA: tetratricopeptide repeat protein, partial [Acidobacteriota bacterium]
MRWMEAQSKGRFFSWLHFYDPHAPYAPPEPFKSRYAENPYDGEIAYTDSVVGRVLDFLIEKGWYDGALVLLTSDHGEDLGEHGENTHGYFVYDSTLRVPLLIKLPHSRYSGKVVGAQVRTIDIMPTVLQIVGGASSGREQGRGLSSLMVSNSARSEDEAFAESYYPYYHFGWNPLLCIRTSRFKYIDAPHPELYELSSDPAEKKNLAAVNGALANQLRDRLRAGYGRLASEHSMKREEMDPATQEKLKSLGYLTYSSRASRLGSNRDLPDPKDKLELYALMQSALMESQNERLDAAIGKLKRLLDLDPTVTDAHIHLGLLYKRLSNFSAAVEEFKLALKSDPSNVVATYNLAHSYASLGRLSDAIIGFQRTLLLNPRESQAQVGMGIAYQMQGAADKAIEHYHAALAIDPFDSTSRNNLASIYLSRRDAVKALEELRRSLEISDANAQTHNLLGSAHWLNSRAEAAIAEFREAIRLDNSYLDPYLNLGMLLGQQNRLQESLGYLKTATELAPRSERAFEILGQTYLLAGWKAQADAAFARARQLSQERER